MPSNGWNETGVISTGSGTSASQGIFYDTGINLSAFSAYPCSIAFQIAGNMTAGGESPPTLVTLQWSSTTGTLTPIAGSPPFSFQATSLGFGSWDCDSYATYGLDAVY